MARELDDAILHAAHQRARDRHLAAEDRGRRRARCSPCDATLLAHAGPLVRARDDRHAAPHARAPRRLVAHAVRADRAGLVLRRHARSSSRSPPTAATCWRCPTTPTRAPKLALSTLNFGALPDGQRPDAPGAPLLRRARRRSTRRAPRSASALDADEALALGLVTAAPDEIDWDDEIRIALEERASMSPDALTGMEANLRFGGRRRWRRASSAACPPGRTGSSAGPNAVGEKGALKVYGTGEKAALRLEPRLTRPTLCKETPMSTSTTARRSRTTSTSPTTARCSARSSTGSPTSSTGGTTMGPEGSHELRRLPAHRGQRRPAGLGALRLREDARLPLGHLPRTRPTPNRKIHFGDHKGEPAWQDVPGEHRANLRRIIVTQGDTEPASVEQQRHLGLTAPVAVRPAQPVPGQRRGRPPPVGDGLPAAHALRPRRPRGGRGAARAPLAATPTTRASSARSTRRRPTGWRSSCSRTSPTATASSSSSRARRDRASIRWRARRKFMLTEEAHHMFVGETRRRRA